MSLSYPIVTIYKSSDIPVILVLLFILDSPGVIVAVLGGILLMLVYCDRGSECVIILRGDTLGWC